MIVDIFWLVVGGGGWLWVMVGGCGYILAGDKWWWVVAQFALTHIQIQSWCRAELILQHSSTSQQPNQIARQVGQLLIIVVETTKHWSGIQQGQSYFLLNLNLKALVAPSFCDGTTLKTPYAYVQILQPFWHPKFSYCRIPSRYSCRPCIRIFLCNHLPTSKQLSF